MDTKDVEKAVYQSCMLMDDQKFQDYMKLCAPDFRYTITTYSPEIRKDMTWLEQDFNGMSSLFKNLPRHNSEHAVLTRQVNVYAVEVAPDGQTAHAVTGLTVYKTTLDGGITELFAVGKYLDDFTLADGQPKLRQRNVKLDTRMLGIGYHIPF